jgi:hypothetical protein
VIWTVLVLILLCVLVLGAIHLWRKLKVLMRTLSDASAVLEPAMAEGEPIHAARASDLPVGVAAVEAEPIVVRAALREEKETRKAVRRARRIDMLHRTGRPRRWGDMDQPEHGPGH